MKNKQYKNGTKAKTSKRHFDYFKTCFLRQKLFGLIHYNVYFKHAKLTNAYADISVDEDGKVATVRFATNWPDRLITSDEINKCALHEISHLLIHRLKWIATCRYVGEEEITEENEALAVRLEKILGGIYDDK